MADIISYLCQFPPPVPLGGVPRRKWLRSTYVSGKHEVCGVDWVWVPTLMELGGGSNYDPPHPINVYKTSDGRIMRIDNNGFVLGVLDEETMTWIQQTGMNSDDYLRPTIFQIHGVIGGLELLFSEADKQEIKSGLTSGGVITASVEYILFGDEPQIHADSIDLKSQMSDSDYNNIKMLFSKMPRAFLYPWFKENVLKSLPGGYEIINKAPVFYYGEGHNLMSPYSDVYGDKHTTERLMEPQTWAAFINTFNEANVEQLTLLGVALTESNFWAWEQKKLENIYAEKAKSDKEHLNETVDTYLEENVAKDPVAQELMQEYNALTPIGDLGLELNRQNAVHELLKQKEYEAVKGIIDAYRYADMTILSIGIGKPIPTDIVTLDGKLIQKTPTNQGA